jgi:hypothetical protein
MDRVDEVEGIGLRAACGHEHFRVIPVAAGDGFEATGRDVELGKVGEEQFRDVGLADTGAGAGDEEMVRKWFDGIGCGVEPLCERRDSRAWFLMPRFAYSPLWRCRLLRTG